MLKKIALILLTSLTFISSSAQAKIDILPRYVVIDSDERSGELTILNMSDDPMSYRMDMTYTAQDTNGKYTKLDTSPYPELNAEDNVRFSPRQFSLRAGGRQKIRVSIRRPSDLPDGDYHIHIRASEINPDSNNKYQRFDDFQNIQNEVRGQSLSIDINVSVSIPIIIRSGRIYSAGEMTNFALIPADETDSGKPQLNFRLLRKGNASLVSKLSVYWTPEGGKKERIGFISNLNVFSEIDYRDVKLNLSRMPTGPGELIAILSDGVKDQVIHEATLK